MNANSIIPYHIHVNDELPTIGSGQRFVFAKEGRKWVSILCPFTATTTRLRLSVWKDLKKGRWDIHLPASIARWLQEAIRRRGDREPTRFEEQVLCSIQG